MTCGIIEVVQKLKKIYRKHKRLFIGMLLSFLWWVVLFTDQLRHGSDNCSPDDNLCNSANTVWGDFTWSIMLAVLSLIFVWTAGLLAYGMWQMFRARKE